MRPKPTHATVSNPDESMGELLDGVVEKEAAYPPPPEYKGDRRLNDPKVFPVDAIDLERKDIVRCNWNSV